MERPSAAPVERFALRGAARHRSDEDARIRQRKSRAPQLADLPGASSIFLMRHQPGKPQSLTGQLLVAHPNMLDPNFRRSVLLISSHDFEEGAEGLIINRPLDKQVSELVTDPAPGASGRRSGLSRRPRRDESANVRSVRLGGPRFAQPESRTWRSKKRTSSPNGIGARSGLLSVTRAGGRANWRASCAKTPGFCKSRTGPR